MNDTDLERGEGGMPDGDVNHHLETTTLVRTPTICNGTHGNDRRFVLGPELGAGAFGVVRRATHVPTSCVVAVKSVDRSLLRKSKNGASGSSAEGRLRREIEGLRLCASHPHIVRLYRSYGTPTSIMLVFEFAGGGDMFDHIKSMEAQRLDNEEARMFFRQVISAVAFMHSRLVSHRDLKVENLILDQSRRNVKIADFGFCRIASSLDEPMNTPCGSPHFCAPEVLDAPDSSYLGPPADVWSCGVILFGMLSGRHPFHEATQSETFKKIRKGDYPVLWHMEEDEVAIISRMLTVDVQARISAEEIMDHCYYCKETNWFLPSTEISTDVSPRTSDPEVISHVVQLYRQEEMQGENGLIVTPELVKRAITSSHDESDHILMHDCFSDDALLETLLDVQCTYEILADNKHLIQQWKVGQFILALSSHFRIVGLITTLVYKCTEAAHYHILHRLRKSK